MVKTSAKTPFDDVHIKFGEDDPNIDVEDFAGDDFKIEMSAAWLVNQLNSNR
jgi:hypothetical protein